MIKEQLIEYYNSIAALDGIDTDNPHQFDSSIGYLIDLVQTVQWFDEKPYPVTQALVENLDTGELSLIDCKLLKKHVSPYNYHLV